MTRRKRGEIPLSRRPVLDAVRQRLRGPLAVALGSPADAVREDAVSPVLRGAT